MKLAQHQIESYERDGYLIFENLLTNDEVRALKERISEFSHYKHMPNVICEEDGSIRSVFTPNRHDDLFDSLYRSDRFVRPSEALINDKAYLYQYKLNLKKAFVGKSWEWHQDFPYWNIDDGVKKPDMISLMLYLDDTRSYQGPLMIIPGSHKFDVVAFKEKKHLAGQDDLINALSADLKYTVNERMIKELADERGIKVLSFKAGTAIFFHPNLFHASSGNLSPYDRDTVIITYNSVNNLPTLSPEKQRPDFICAQDYSNIHPISGSILQEQIVK